MTPSSGKDNLFWPSSLHSLTRQRTLASHADIFRGFVFLSSLQAFIGGEKYDSPKVRGYYQHYYSAKKMWMFFSCHCLIKQMVNGSVSLFELWVLIENRHYFGETFLLKYGKIISCLWSSIKTTQLWTNLACKQALCLRKGWKNRERREGKGVPFPLFAIFSPFHQIESLFTG